MENEVVIAVVVNVFYMTLRCARYMVDVHFAGAFKRNSLVVDGRGVEIGCGKNSNGNDC